MHGSSTTKVRLNLLLSNFRACRTTVQVAHGSSTCDQGSNHNAPCLSSLGHIMSFNKISNRISITFSPRNSHADATAQPGSDPDSEIWACACGVSHRAKGCQLALIGTASSVARIHMYHVHCTCISEVA